MAYLSASTLRYCIDINVCHHQHFQLGTSAHVLF